MTTSLLKSLGLFSVFWPILIMLLCGWSPLVLLFPSLPVPLPSLWVSFKVHQFQLVSPPPSVSIVFILFCFVSCSLARSWYLSLISLSFIFTLWSARMSKSTICLVLFFFVFFFFLTISRYGHLAKIRWSVCSTNHHRTLCVPFSGTDSGLYI